MAEKPDDEQGRVVRVEAYSGYRANERPLAVTKGERRQYVRRVLERRRTPDSEEFLIEMDDASLLRLVWDRVRDRWSTR